MSSLKKALNENRTIHQFEFLIYKNHPYTIRYIVAVHDKKCLSYESHNDWPSKLTTNKNAAEIRKVTYISHVAK